MVLNWFIGISFAELNGLMPRVQGGTGQYLLAGIGPLPSLIGNLSAYVITEILSMTAEITLCGLVLKGLFLPHVDNRIISIIIMALFLVINLFWCRYIFKGTEHSSIPAYRFDGSYWINRCM